MNISIEKFSKKINEIINRITNKEKDKIKEAAKILAKKYKEGSHLYIFGTGHNHCIAEESLHRSGAFAGVTPMLDDRTDFSQGITKASTNERNKSLAKKILEKYKPLKDDSVIIFSNSGINQLPIEMGRIAKKRGLFVITVLSIKYANSLTSKSFKNLSHYSDIYINNYSPIGDIIFEEKNIGID